MPRPCKRRRICAMPACQRFGPKGHPCEGGEPILMTVDEFEAVRLIDHEGMNQEQCAEQMDIARTTVQSIYSSATAVNWSFRAVTLLSAANAAADATDTAADGADAVRRGSAQPDAVTHFTI